MLNCKTGIVLNEVHRDSNQLREVYAAAHVSRVWLAAEQRWRRPSVGGARTLGWLRAVEEVGCRQPALAVDEAFPG